MAAPRIDIEFPSARESVSCRGWLYPAQNDATPTIVMAHGIGAVKEMRIDAYAERFAAQGYACLAFDYRGFGASDGQPRQVVDVPSQLADWASAIAHARRIRPAAPVILWGSSFSGGHVLAAGAKDGNVAAVIAQCPHTSGPAAVRQIDLWTLTRAGGRAIQDLVAKLLHRKPVLVPLYAAPGQLALMNSPGSEASASRLMATAGRAAPPNGVAARIGLFIGTYSPGKYARKLRCPVLFCLCTKDSVTPASVARRYASQAAQAEVRDYPVGHFDIYLDEPFERTIVDQIDFLKRHAPPS